MNDKTKKYLTGVLCCVAAMFIWIFVTVGLTGGREVEDFTDRDRAIMVGFAVLEIVTVIAMFFFAVRLGVQRGKDLRMQMQTVATTPNKPGGRRGAVLMILALAVAFGTMIGGIVLRKGMTAQAQNVSGWLMGICIALGTASLLLNIFLGKWYVGRFAKRKIGQLQQYVYSHRECAEETAAKKLSLIKYWRLFTAGYALFLAALGLCVALCGGILYNSGSGVQVCFVAFLFILSAFSRLRFPASQRVLDADETYISEDRYPRLYAVAKKAAQTIGCSGRIRVALLPDCNAGIAKIGHTYSVQVGVILLATFSEEELYSVLLHEFAHMSAGTGKARKESDYYAWICDGKTTHCFFWITDLFYSYLDAYYGFEFSLYKYASSIRTEAAADQAMLLCGDPAAVASALLKLKYYEQFEWEKGVQDAPSIYEPEMPDQQLLTKEVEKFRQAMEHRSQTWNQLVDVEIQSRSASHPTVKQRLASLGIKDLRILDARQDSAYGKECQNAQDHVSNLLCENVKECYRDRRNAAYLEPKAQVEQWEAAGRPLVVQEYGDVVWALQQLGRCTEALELCQRAIAELPDAASCCGYFIRGLHRLHSYDPAGIEDIYFAIENNSNYLDEGLGAIGSFCCMTGNQKELDIYRQKAVELAQKQKDQYVHTGILTKKDRLTEENLPDGMLDGILEYIRSIDDGQIEKIYLVRKTITEDFFTSVFVVRFELQAEEDSCDRIIHKIFQHLDTCSDWQFSLFDYREVSSVPVHKIKNSCVYSKEDRS